MIDFDKIQKEIESGYIMVRKHPTEPLRILNYTPSVQFERRWNTETMLCRGLIVNDDDKVVSRPFVKFFNWEEVESVPNESFVAYEKHDGSLAIGYQINGKMYIASRGSFDSDQARKANEILQSKYSHVIFEPHLTYLWEIIYADNRIVVDYGDTEDLILLAIIDTVTGKDLPLVDIGFPCAKHYNISDFDELVKNQDDSREGYVVLFAGGARLKVKFDEYKRLHRLVTGVTEKSIFDLIASGGSVDVLLDRVPDEHYKWVRSVEQKFRNQYRLIELECLAQFSRYERYFEGQNPERKESALFILRCNNPHLLFSMLDGKDYSKQIWQIVENATKSP